MKLALTLLTFLYPWLCYHGDGRLLTYLMLALWSGRAIIAPTPNARWGALAVALFFLTLALIAPKNNNFLYLYPIFINLGLLTLFASSLFTPQSLIERLARRQHPNLSAEGQQYTRRVTQIWCIFFALNAGITALLALRDDKTAWTLYTGIISYLAIGLLLAGEWLYRQYKQPK